MQILSGLTFGVMVQPLAALSQIEIDQGLQSIPTIDHLDDVNGPFRCNRCKAYVNPHFQFT